MAQGIVKSVTPNGTFEGSYGLMYKFEIEIGEHIGEYASKSKDQTKFVVGQQAEYDFIGGKYPKIKPVYNKPFTSGNKSFNDNPERQLMIVKQSSIKVASDLCIAEGKTDVNSVIAKAEEIIKWVMAEKKEVKQEFTKVQPKDDLPF
jgi:hypothetical protein